MFLGLYFGNHFNLTDSFLGLYLLKGIFLFRTVAFNVEDC